MAWGPMSGFGMPVQKPKNARGTLFRLLGYFKPMRYQVLAVLAAAILSTVFNVVGPKVLGLATTTLFEGLVAKSQGTGAIDFPAIGRILLILVGLYLVSSLFQYIQQYLMTNVAQRSVYAMRKQVEEKFARLPLKFYDSRTHGEILSRAVNDMDSISSTLQQNLTQLITSIVTVVGVILLMLTISPLLTLVVGLTLPISLFITATIAKRSQTFFRRQQMALGELNGHVEEMFTGHKIVKAFGREQQSVAEFKGLNDHYYDAGWRAQFATGMIMPIMTFVGNVSYVCVAVIGGYMVTRGAIAIGDVQAFIQYSRQFSQPIMQLSSIANTIQLTLASAERVFELLDEPEEIPDAAAARVIAEPRGAVEFAHVKFSYKPDVPLIEDLSIDVKPGQTIAIVGPTGAGKTTLVNLLMRFYDVDAGAIRVDGIDVRELQRGSLRRMIGMVLQDTWLFSGTIRENIAYGHDGATHELVVQAAKAAQADHFIRTLHDSYDTVLTGEATTLSQGQKQLLTIARAFLADPAILILDEATSSVDTRTEVLIQAAMADLMKDRTSFVIAHRLSTIRNADLILVMDHGSIVEQGPHEQLLAQRGVYAELYESQFSGRGLEQVPA
ncbi:MAG: ATP-binding cassette, subfamily multidrug efflux pump [Chloroflexota bacterium]|nr:ATP-binding cassette, subfamily multidrug efflux pump [Chloroflexota bacterium]